MSWSGPGRRRLRRGGTRGLRSAAEPGAGTAGAARRQPERDRGGGGEAVGQLYRQGARAHRMQRELELDDNAEVAATTAQAPEELGMLVGGCAHHVAVGGDERARDEVVACESMPAREPPHAAA